MTVQPEATAQTENVSRGALFALATLPVAIIAFGIFGWIGVFPFIIGILTPFVADWLYQKGAGAKLTKRGWLPVIAISLISVIVGAFASVFATVYSVYGQSAQFTNSLAINLRSFDPQRGGGFTIVLAIVLGIVGIVLVLRGRGFGRAAVTPAPQAPAASPFDQAPAVPPVAPPAPGTPMTPPPVAPSPGVTLNGEPVDPDKK